MTTILLNIVKKLWIPAFCIIRYVQFVSKTFLESPSVYCPTFAYRRTLQYIGLEYCIVFNDNLIMIVKQWLNYDYLYKRSNFRGLVCWYSILSDTFSFKYVNTFLRLYR